MDRRRLLALAAVLSVAALLLLFPSDIASIPSIPKWTSASTRLKAGFAQQATGFDWLRTRDIIVFGDSFSSTRATAIKDGRPEGLDTHAGLKWCDYLFAMYKPTGRYYNYALDGATIDANLVPPRLPESGTLDAQIEAFANDSSRSAGESLFVLVLGINDVREMARREFPSSSLHTTASALPAALTTRMEALHARGARHFLTFTLAALDHAPKYSQPSGIGHNVSSFLSAGISAYNAALPGAMASWAAEKSVGRDHINVMVFPWDALFDLMCEQHEAFGITDETHFRVTVDGEGRDPGTVGMVYQDPSHPTWPIAQTLARSVNGFLARQSSSWGSAERGEKDITVK